MESKKQSKKVSEQEPQPPQAPVPASKKLTPADNIDTWDQVFQTADPERYHQFRQDNRPGTKKSPDHIKRMASAAHYAARQPVKNKRK